MLLTGLFEDSDGALQELASFIESTLKPSQRSLEVQEHRPLKDFSRALAKVEKGRFEGLVGSGEIVPHASCVPHESPGSSAKVLDPFHAVNGSVQIVGEDEGEARPFLALLRVQEHLLMALPEEKIEQPPGLESRVIAQQELLAAGGMGLES